ncbi:purine phosphorylase [Amycolatopsis sp. cg9]|uniref:5'-methylthioadenosine/S-adenosylhomocysteine nucleosidase family protein n=1 Tax=Amycolatopsis sp. cg9 TaxID=3238801 RepID=UPI003525006E
MKGAREPVVVILTALDVEYEAVRTHLGSLREVMHEKGTLFEVGSPPEGTGSIALAITGQGNPAAGILAERAIGMFAPEALLFVGVAGGLHDDLEPGDVVVATKVYGYHGGQEDASGFHARPQAWELPHRIDNLARHVKRQREWTSLLPAEPGRQPAVHLRPVAAGEVVLNSRTTPLAEQLRDNYNDAAAIEMESAGVSKAAHLNDSHPVATIRGVSDKADGHKHTADKAGWQPIAAAHAAAFALTLAAKIIDHARHEEARHHGTPEAGGLPAAASHGAHPGDRGITAHGDVSGITSTGDGTINIQRR